MLECLNVRLFIEFCFALLCFVLFVQVHCHHLLNGILFDNREKRTINRFEKY